MLGTIDMAKIEVCDFESDGYVNHMRYIDDAQRVAYEKAQKLIPYKVCLVTVCNFTFTFHSVMQLDLCIEYYSKDIQPTSRLPFYSQNFGGDHWETQRWFEKLPQYLLEKPKRIKVLAALERARKTYAIFPTANTNTPKPNIWRW